MSSNHKKDRQGEISPVDIKRGARKAIARAAPWLQILARFGYVAKGVVYCIIGAFALMTAVGLRTKTTDAAGALELILSEPFGNFLLILIVIGFAGYALRRFVQAVRDPESLGLDLKGIISRAGFAVSGLSYAFLAWTAIELMEGVRRNTHVTQRWTARFLHLPHGQWLVIAVGSAILAAGVYGVVFGIRTKFLKSLNFHLVNRIHTGLLTHLGRFGYAARGAVFIVVGMFLIQAGIHADPNTAKGMDGAQNALEGWSDWALCLIAVGLVSFGCFMFVEAKYNRILIK